MHIIEVGPRDGLQNEQKILDVATKVAYIEQLIHSGAKRIEAVSFAHPKRVPQMADAEAVMEAVPRDASVNYIGLVMNDRGADRAIQSGVDEANIVVVATDTFAQKNQGMSMQETVEAAQRMTQKLKDAQVQVTVTIGAAFGCPFEGEVATSRVIEMVQALSTADIDELGLADTIGVAVPVDIKRTVEAVREHTDLPLRMHLHNTRNNGYANALAALELGVDRFDASSGGIGGCPFAPAATGNIATEDLLYLASRSGYPTSLDFQEVLKASEMITGALEIKPPALLGRAGWFPTSTP